MLPCNLKRNHDGNLLVRTQDNGLIFCETLSNVIMVNDFTPPDCWVKVVDKDNETFKPQEKHMSFKLSKVALKASFASAPSHHSFEKTDPEPSTDR